jgi:predicted RNase H-like HicB family nuclease
MELNYYYWKEDNFYLGYISEYPQYPTQGESIEDLENGLREIYGWIKDGTLKIKERKGILKIA